MIKRNNTFLKKKYAVIILLITIMASCVSIPKETVTLSQTLGKDLTELQNSHMRMVEIHYSKVKSEINTFVDDVYTPFIIHYVLSSELKKHHNGQASIYGVIETAGSVEGKEESKVVLQEMSDFLQAAYHQIKVKRQELLDPVIQQEAQILKSVNQSYSNVIHANTTLTAYLQSVRKIKGAQKEALSVIGLAGADVTLTESMIKLSESVSKTVNQSKKIDIQSDDAFQKIKEISEQIKKITNKK